MDRLYALGVSCIEIVQDWFGDHQNYFELVNDLSNPHYVVDILFPLVSIVDSVFASQLLLCLAFGGWLNAVMKWWLLEDRPYWWVRETNFYADSDRPHLLQFRQTCETGPGCPSGHSATMAMLLMLGVMWISHVMNDRKYYIWWWKYIAYTLFVGALVSVMLARMFVATHFPHQCLLGALIGMFLAPALCIYVSDPYIWQYGFHMRYPTRKALCWHLALAATTMAISGITYLSLVMNNCDPHWTIDLAIRWCDNPDDIHVSTTPMFALVQSAGLLLGWALYVTPAVAQYRHYTTNRSIIISAFATGLLLYVFKHIQHNLNENNPLRYYAVQFVMGVLTPMLFLRLTPALATWPYTKSVKMKTA